LVVVNPVVLLKLPLLVVPVVLEVVTGGLLPVVVVTGGLDVAGLVEVVEVVVVVGLLVVGLFVAGVVVVGLLVVTVVLPDTLLS
jgi:hypothetical protein